MKHEPMTQEQLDAIRERVDASSAPWMPAKPDEVYRAEDGKQVAWNLDPEDVDLIAHAPDDLADLLAEVERLRALLTVDDAMVERAARVLYLREIAWSSKAEWDHLPDPVKKMWHLKAGAVLDAVHDTGEDLQ